MRIAGIEAASGKRFSEPADLRYSRSLPDIGGLAGELTVVGSLAGPCDTNAERLIWLDEAIFRSGLLSKVLLHRVEFDRSEGGRQATAYAAVRIKRILAGLGCLLRRQFHEYLEVF